MSFSKMGKVFPKRGKVFPERHPAGRYAVVIAAALRDELGDTHHAIKTVINWTGASERTVKNWFSGSSGPSGAHLIGLARHSDDVFEALLLLSGREPPQEISAKNLADLHEKLREALQLVQLMCRPK